MVPALRRAPECITSWQMGWWYEQVRRSNHITRQGDRKPEHRVKSGLLYNTTHQKSLRGSFPRVVPHQ